MYPYSRNILHYILHCMNLYVKLKISNFILSRPSSSTYFFFVMLCYYKPYDDVSFPLKKISTFNIICLNIGYTFCQHETENDVPT